MHDKIAIFYHTILCMIKLYYKIFIIQLIMQLIHHINRINNISDINCFNHTIIIQLISGIKIQKNFYSQDAFTLSDF